jgi:hypothetical protein
MPAYQSSDALTKEGDAELMDGAACSYELPASRVVEQGCPRRRGLRVKGGSTLLRTL